MKLSLLITILLSCLLAACNSAGIQNEKTLVKASFIGQIENINNQNATVVVTEDESTNKITGPIIINLSVNPDETFKVGDKVKVGYDGTTMETAPVRIKTLTVEKIVPAE